jgi:hypothetical protein
MRPRLECGVPFLKTSYNSHKILVIYLVVAFRRGMLLGVEGHGVKDSLIVMLREYTGGDVVGYIGFYKDFLVGLEVGKNRSRGE